MICVFVFFLYVFFFQAEDGIRDGRVTGVQTCALPISDRVLRVDPDSGRGWLRRLSLGAAGLVAAAMLDDLGENAHRDLLGRQRADRSEERRVGKECRFRWSPYH